MSNQSQITVVSEEKSKHNDIESQSQPSPPRSSFVLLWLTFVLACMGTIILSHWNNPNAPIHSTEAEISSQVQRLTKTYESSPPPSSPTSSCDPLSLRREWRTLSTPEQQSYQSAIRCLLETPSISDTGSHYADFLAAYDHENWTANSTSRYLPWNRWYLHSLERALRRDCHYTGDMVYLDWTLDLDELSASEESSFPGSELGAQKPISETVSDVKTGYLDAEHVSRILSATSYNEFVKSLAQNIAKVSPLDLSSGEAPKDPAFLHQMQVDRLWWMWQQRNTDLDLPIEVSSDEVKLDGLATPVRVAGIADAEAGGLCYRYI